MTTESTPTKQPLDLDALFPELSQIRDVGLREAVVAIWQELWQRSAYQRIDDVPVSSSIDYPQVKHARGVLRAALAVAPIWEEVHGVHFDRDVLIAGALLMDVSKMVESGRDAGGKPAKTEVGRLLPHATLAAHLAMQHGVPLPVVHVITCHSPNGGKAPATHEAELLDSLDQADIAAFGHTIWTRKVMHWQP